VTRRLPPSAWLFAACGIWMTGLGLYFIFIRPPLLPEDPRYMGSTLQDIQATLPGLSRWLGRVFTVMGGFMAGAGLLTLFAATSAVPARAPGTGWILAIAGLLTVVLMSAVNFALDSDFKWLLLAPALAWMAAISAYAAEGRS
jgi:hypothetical protein